MIEMKLCPICLEEFPCKNRCKLILVDKTKVAISQDFILAYPDAFRIIVDKRGKKKAHQII